MTFPLRAPTTTEAGKLVYNTKESDAANVKNSKSDMMSKIITQRNNIIAKQQQQLLPALLQNPLDLVEKTQMQRGRGDN